MQSPQFFSIGFRNSCNFIKHSWLLEENHYSTMVGKAEAKFSDLILRSFHFMKIVRDISGLIGGRSHRRVGREVRNMIDKLPEMVATEISKQKKRNEKIDALKKKTQDIVKKLISKMVESEDGKRLGYRGYYSPPHYRGYYGRNSGKRFGNRQYYGRNRGTKISSTDKEEVQRSIKSISKVLINLLLRAFNELLKDGVHNKGSNENRNGGTEETNESPEAPETEESLEPPEKEESLEPPETEESPKPPETEESPKPPETEESLEPTETEESPKPPETEESDKLVDTGMN